MKQILLISALVFFGVLNLSASKSERLLGKWQAYKMIHEGETRNFEKSKRIPWIEFAEDNVVWAGEGKKGKKKGEWWLEEDNKTVHLIIRDKDIPMMLKRISKKKIILDFKDGRSSTKSYWKKVS